MRKKHAVLRVRRSATRFAGAPRTAGAERCRRKFLRLFPEAFRDETYLAWERDYKWQAHREWEEHLGRSRLETFIRSGDYSSAAAQAVRIESRTNLLFSFEKMALRDAVRVPSGAKTFVLGLNDLLYGEDDLKVRFARWCDSVGELPRRQTRVLTWPLVTVFAFIAQPKSHIFLKPNTTKEAARKFGFDFHYVSRPNWETYASYRAFAAAARAAVSDWRPRDMIDIQSFLWVQGADEYR